MLTTLRIKNLALVADLTLELQPGYNAITGETGAGKSIILGALNLVLGERADRTLIRSDCDSCSVEAVFTVGVQASACPSRTLKRELQRFLDENGLEPCEDNQLVLKRTFTSAGTNRQFINGSPTTLNVLKQIGEWLLDMHGPHDHQSLLNPAQQLAMLDAFGKLQAQREKFSGLIQKRNALEAEKSALIVDERTYAQQLDLLRFQANEISAAKLNPDEESQVEQDYQRASNAARLLQLAQSALDALSESDTSLLTQAGAVGRALQELQRIDASAAPLARLHEQAVGTLRELQSELSHYADKVDINPARLAELEERLNLIHSLKRKYGVTLADVIAFGEDARKKLQSLESRDADLTRINSEIAKLDSELLRVGKELSAARKKVFPQLSKAIEKQLAALGFKQSKFDVAMTSAFKFFEIPLTPFLSPSDGERVAEGRVRGNRESSSDEAEFRHRTESPKPETRNPKLSPTGFDAIEFQFAPNPGEPARPLRAIASSGEMARVMLAIKTVLAAEDEIPVLVFDEVDANVGGETANAVGEKMRQIAKNRQVLCITHLPQVASHAEAHFVVTKQLKNGRTISEITLLDKRERVTELARMLGGQSDAARKHAETLLK